MAGIALHGLDEIRDEVLALFQLHIYISKGLVAALSLADQPVIDGDDGHGDDRDDTENDVKSGHG